ncbi:MAG: hypothetical protein JO040_10190 [Gemmatimonadetes bacterium]|nr:hypothetical protein [Gemmatimonadota bacterium]
MVAISMEGARAELALVEGQLEECIREAWGELRTIQATIHPGMRVRCRRTLLQDLVIKHVEAAFEGVPGFQLIECDGGRVVLIVSNRLLLQFKHIDHEFKTANIPTETALNFNAQLEIEGLPSIPRLTVGYRLDQLETKVEGIYIMFAINNQPQWTYRLDEDGASGTETLDLLPNEPAPVTSTPEQRRVVPKRVADIDKVVPLHTQQ